MVSGEQKLLAILSHVAYLAGGIGFITVPLLILLLRKEDDFVYGHAKQALLAHVSILIASVLVGLLTFVLIGVLLLPCLVIVWLIFFVCSLLAAYRAMQSETYRYPMIQWLSERLE